MLRLVEMKEREKTTQAQVSFFRRVKSAESMTIIEENKRPVKLKNGAVPITFAPAGIETIRVAW